jgi:hypothetical protein
MSIELSLFVSKLLPALKYLNGAYLIVACAAAGVLAGARLPHVRTLSPAAFVVLAGLGLAYVFYPNFLDHAEPAMATLGMVLLQGRPLYPALDVPSFHGLLYGPLVAESQAAAIYLGATLAGLPVMLVSKLMGFATFLLACALFFRIAPGWGFARTYYVLFLLPFGLYTFWNRCEPPLLLLVVLGFWAAGACSPRRALLIIGICAGLASGLKVHACLYLAPAAFLVLVREKPLWQGLLVLAGAAASSFLLLFLPAHVSLAAFLEYLRLAGEHGLSAEQLFKNLIFLCALWAPLLVLPERGRLLRERPMLGLLGLQLLVTVIASKPGAGIHHLLPFIPANALLFAPRAEASPGKGGTGLVWLAALVPGVAAALQLGMNMAREWRTYESVAAELATIRARHPGVVMGVGGKPTYAYTFMRPLLEHQGAPQIEYSSYMDLRLVGVPDTSLQLGFETCRIRHLAVPKGEPPFSLVTYYSETEPLFSDELRTTFARRYEKIAAGRWFDTYECRPA